MSVNQAAKVGIHAVPTPSKSLSSGQPSCADIWNSPAWNLVFMGIRDEFTLKVITLIQSAPVIRRGVLNFFGRRLDFGRKLQLLHSTIYPFLHCLYDLKSGLTKVELGGNSWKVVGGIDWRQKEGVVMVMKNGLGCEDLTSGQQTGQS